jgi:hypothetical protein
MIGNTMTSACRPARARPRAWGWLCLAALAALAAVGPVGAATTTRVAVDPQSGLAIWGFDPVAYFTDRMALPGREEFEHTVAGAVWQFRNAGNAAAFLDDPEVYEPRFGGYDPVGVARGVPVPGNPRFWLILDDRLYLFYSADTKDAFARDSGRIIATAEATWQEVQSQLAE